MGTWQWVAFIWQIAWPVVKAAGPEIIAATNEQSAGGSKITTEEWKRILAKVFSEKEEKNGTAA